ncbi:MAG TPA: Asp23/Gls24 family envelope stress response protein [Sandaracinaceae bacterium LLY-WYZ-13_1]|nr:Asp23/Gls24 family envelope stress response protein [Sandaracinaceae bacterium LLY-WYZ-13_1]
MAETQKKQTQSKTNDNGKNITLQKNEEGMRGTITLDEEVVATIAGMCAKQIEGIYSLKPRLIPFGNENTTGVDVEVGSKQAAVDLDVIMEYGTDIEACANELRKAMSDEIGKMANREVVEVNIHVSDIHLPESEGEQASEEDEAPRVV